jgi:hypothetical protein
MPPRVRFRLTRGLDAPSGKIPPRSRAGHPLARGSASLEGWSPPWASLRLTQGPHGLAAPVPAPLTGAFNVMTPAGAQVKDESTHAIPLTLLGIISWRCSANPPGQAIPTTVRHYAVRPSSAP